MYLCGGLPLIIDAFGRQSSMRCVAIISCSECALFGDGVTLRSGGKLIDLYYRSMPQELHKEKNVTIITYNMFYAYADVFEGVF